MVSDIVNLIDNYDTDVHTLDKIPDMNELDLALKSIRKGASFDGLPPKILYILPPSLKEVILRLLQKIFVGKFPTEWNKQLLHAITKSGHTYKNPQLRGIAVAPLLCRVYDTIMDNRFRSWPTPNPEQSGFRAKQGCLLPLFNLMLLISFCKEVGRSLFVGFLDFEKAFDFVNRAILLCDLMKFGCGKRYLRALMKMYTETLYAPKVKEGQLGKSISTHHGVTQGRKSSSNLFSFFVSDMPESLNNLQTTDFLDPYNLLQLADDTSLLAEFFEAMQKKFRALFLYSGTKYQVANIKKTFYCHFSNNPITEPMHIDDETIISSVDQQKGHPYLGMSFFPTNSIEEIVKFNVNKRMWHVAKFYGWLEVNENTPIESKLHVLDQCVFGAYLYASECWGNISYIEKKLLTTEMLLLKRICNVKKGTTNDLVLFELKRSPVTTRIRDRQCAFYQNLLQFTTDDAVVTNFLQLCNNSQYLRYYQGLRGNESSAYLENLAVKLQTDDRSMIVYYRNHIKFEKSCIYSLFMNDYYRKIITRWRLSNHSLKIETGRYTRIPRESRVCSYCNVVEDEEHVILRCPMYFMVRGKYQHITTGSTIDDILNPSKDNVIATAKLLYEIEDVRKEMLKL